MELYNLNTFTATIKKAKSIYCSNDLDFGLKLYKTTIALRHKYIQVNNEKAIKFLVIDLDHDNPMIWDNVKLPAPNLCVKDRIKNTSHLIYALEYPIFKEYEQNYKALALFAKIQQVYTKLLKGDPLYANMITKNPLHSDWQTIIINPFRTYSLYELADYVDLPKNLLKRDVVGEGRNCYLFDTVRVWAYKEVLFYKANQATESDFRNVVLAQLEKLNNFPNSSPLGFNELKGIAKSISKWTWMHFSLNQFREIQSTRAKKLAKTRKKAKEDRLNSYE